MMSAIDLLIAVAMALGGAGVLVVVFKLQRGEAKLTGPNTFLALAGICLITGAVMYGTNCYQQYQDRKTFDAAVERLFGQTPKSEEIEGKSLLEFYGTCVVKGKRYELKTNLVGENEHRTSFQVQATPAG